LTVKSARVRVNGKTSAHLKSVFKMSTVCSNASSKAWSPLPDPFIDDHLVEMSPLFDQARLQLVNVFCNFVVETFFIVSNCGASCSRQVIHQPGDWACQWQNSRLFSNNRQILTKQATIYICAKFGAELSTGGLLWR